MFADLLRKLFTTPYTPDATCASYLDRAQRQGNSLALVTAAVLDAAESERIFGVPLARRGIQPVFLRIENQSEGALRMQMMAIDPNYYTPLEAAGVNHFSILKRLSAFGLVGWIFFHVLLPLIPIKLFTAFRANRRMDELFRERAFRLRPIAPHTQSEGFVFTQLDSGTKVFRVCLYAAEKSETDPEPHANRPALELTFSIPVPGIHLDHLRRDFSSLLPPGSVVDCNVHELVNRLGELPAATSNRQGSRAGDPVNLIVVGDFPTLLTSFVARWDETEPISFSSSFKTFRSFVIGTEYRYSPVSPLHLFGRSQDVALQRTRQSINERLHLRLWLAPLTLHGVPVWVGQVSRDIGVRFTWRTWNLTTHRIDPDVDEARDYVVEDLLSAEHVKALGYVDGVGECSVRNPRHNLTGDPYFTDGKRAVLALSQSRIRPHYVSWG